MKYLRMFADEMGGSHFEFAELNSKQVPFMPPAPPIHVSDGQLVDNLVFKRVPNGRSHNGHPAPRKQWVMILKGEIEFEVSDDEVQRLAPSAIVLAEDTVGKDHKARTIGNEDVVFGIAQVFGSKNAVFWFVFSRVEIIILSALFENQA